MKIQVIQTLPNGQVTQQVLSKEDSEVLMIQAQSGAKISFNVEGAKPTESMNAKAKTGTFKKSGNNLVLESEGEALVEVNDFHTTAGASVGNVGWNYASTDATVMSATLEAQALSSDAAVAESGVLLPVIAPSWLVAGGAAVVAVATSGGSSAVGTTVISGSVVLGPVKAGNGLTVTLYKADGSELAAAVAVGPDGKFTSSYSAAYAGVVMARLKDSSVGVDYRDEATHADKDLTSDIRALFSTISAGTTNITLSALSEMAVRQILGDSGGDNGTAGVAAGTKTATEITAKNAALAVSLGLTGNVVTDFVINPTVNADGTAATANAAGLIVAALSGLDAVYGTDGALDKLTTSGITATNVLNLVAEGALQAGLLVVISAAVPAVGAAVTAASSEALTVDAALLDAAGLAALSPLVLSQLSTAQIALLPSSAMSGLTTAQLAALTGDQISAITVGQIGNLSPSQITALGLDVASLSIAAVDSMTLAQGLALTSAQLGALINATAPTGASLTNDTTPTMTGTFSGRMPPGASIQILDDGVAVGTATVNGTSWTWTPSTSIGADGVHHFTAEMMLSVVTASIQATAATSSSYSLTLDTAAPTLAISNYNAAENGTVVNLGAALVGADAHTMSYTLAGPGADNGVFSITSAGVLTLKAPKNFEAGGSSASTNDYAVTVDITDAAGNVSHQSITVHLTDVNEAPAFGVAPTAGLLAVIGQSYSLATAASFSDVDANGMVGGTYTATGLTNGLTIDPTTGVISSSGLTGTDATDHVSVVFTDARGLSSAAAIFDINIISAPAVASFSVADSTGTDYSKGKSGEVATFLVVFTEAVDVGTTNGTPTITFTANGHTVVATYAGGTGTNTLTFTGALPAGDGNAISLNSIALNGGSIIGTTAGSHQPLLLTSTGQNFAGYAIDNTAPTLSPLTVAAAENNLAVATLTTDDTGATFSTILDGTDGSLFSISASGVLTFNATKNFEVDAHSYNVGVTVLDAQGNSRTQNVAVNLTNVNEAPTATTNLVSNQTAVVGQPYTSLDLSSYFTDVDAAIAANNETRHYTITSGLLPDGLILDATTGVISSTGGALHDLENGPITITMTDSGGLPAIQTFNFQAVTAPVVTHFSVADISGATNTGKLGATVSVVLTFTEPVDVVGTPTITLEMNGASVTGTYVSADVTHNTVTFTATLPAGDGTAISLTHINTSTGNTLTGHSSIQPWTILTGASTTYYTVDNTASAAPTLTSVTDDVAAITGIISAGGTTNDTAPTVRVTLATTGANAVVAGDTVQLYNSTTALGSVVTLSATDASNGYVDITPTGLTNGTTYTINAKVTDAAGNTSMASGNYAVTIDTAAPVISAVTFGTTTGALKVGDTLTATITADQATYTAGAISINGKAATGFTNIGDNTYTVTYTVVQGDVDVLDTAVIPVSVVLIDTAGNSNTAYTTAPVFSSAPAVDAHVPTITDVAITATGAQSSTLNATDVITATVTFSESVTATAGSTLGILVGSATRQAIVTAATGNTLTYTYTVVAGDIDADGISVPAGGFTLNAGTIKDAAGNNAVLTYTAVAAQAAYKVDTEAPTITATETVTENSTTVALHYTDASASLLWALAGAGVDNGKFIINSATGVLTFNAAPNFEAPIDSGANNVYDVTVTATDLAGNVLTATPVAISVTNVNEAPTLSGSIAAQHAISGTAYSFDVHNFFSDPDAGFLPATYSTLTYSATGLASNLSINATTGVISGIHTGAVAAAPVVVTATDGGGLVVSQAAFNMDVVVAPALTATQALDGVGTGLATALSVQSALVISFDSVVTLGSGHIHIYDDMGTTGWAHTNTTTLESVADSSKNDIDITIDATTHQATAVSIGGVDYTTSGRFNLAASVTLDSTGHNLVIDLKQATASAAGTGVWSTTFDWDFGANYHVNFDAGIVKNLAGIGNAALNDGSATATGALQNTTINFTTVAPTNAGTLSQVMDSTGSTTGLVDSLYWINGNQGSNAGATPTTIDLSGKNTAVVLDSNGATSASGGLQGNILLKNFGFDTNAWNRNDFIYMDNHGNQNLLTTDGLVAAASFASASTNLSVSNGSTVNSVRSLTDTGSVGGSSYLYIDGSGLPTGTTWGSGLSSESTFELASKGAYNAIIFG